MNERRMCYAKQASVRYAEVTSGQHFLFACIV